MASGTPGSDFSGQQPSPPSAQQRKASHNSPHGLNSRSCVTCRRRKVKCDKNFPCSNCTKGGTECVFPAPGRAPRKPRQGGKVVSEREAELLKRLRRLEGVVEELSGQVEVEALRHSPSSENSSAPKDGESSIESKPHIVRVVGMDEGSKSSWLARSFRIGSGPPKPAFNVEAATQGMGKLVVDEGKSRYVASTFWASITDEVDEIKGMLEDDDSGSDYSDAPVRPNNIVTEPSHQSFIMGYSSSDVNLKDLHPLPSQIPFYWQTFLDNVQPMTMLIHRPTMTKTIKEIQTNLDNLSPSTEALMFSIYHATIISMSSEEVTTNLGVNKDKLLKQYRFGVEQSLARASFLNTDEIVTVQAFVLFLICVRRHDDSRFVWSLTGLALRLAQSLGIHRDGSRLGLTPFDTEMRRRLWWQICILDLRASEDYGSDPSILDCTFDTAYPLSINDDDIKPEDVTAPTPREGVSEITFVLIRCEICSLIRKLTYVAPGAHELRGSSIPTLDEKEALVKEASLRMEDKYLKYCENAGPLFWVAATVARLIITKMRLLIYHPLIKPGSHMELSPQTRDSLFEASIEIIEYSRILEDESTTKQFGWLFHTYVQWKVLFQFLYLCNSNYVFRHAIAFLLGELAERDNSVTVDRAWRAMHGIFDAWGGEIVLKKRHMLWQPMRHLMAKARAKREQNKKAMQSTALAINSNYSIAQPITYSALGNTSGPSNFPSNESNQPISMGPNTSMYNVNNTPMVESQSVGMGMLAPEHVQHELQHQQLALPAWTMDDAFLDMDMAGLETDPNWNGWDDMIRDYQMELDTQGNMGRGPNINGLGNWW